jgi:hypothetical protein
MPVRTRLGRAATVGTLGLSIAGSALVLAPSAHAADTGHGTISCSAVNSATVGVGYRHDKVAYDQWVYKRAEKTWYTRGTVQRKSDGKKVRGYVLYGCANPYGTNSAPKPPIPK